MRPIGALALLLTLTGCATTVVESNPPTTSSTLAPSAVPDDFDALLAAVIERATAVAAAMNSGDRERAGVESVELGRLWERLEPLAAARGRTFLEDARRLVDLTRIAVERNRPADANKAVRFFSLLLDSGS